MSKICRFETTDAFLALGQDNFQSITKCNQLPNVRSSPHLSPNVRSEVKPKVKNCRTKKVDQFLKQETIIGESSVTLTLPLKTVSEGNSFEHWQKKHSRHKDQQRLIRIFMNPYVLSKIKLPCTITVKRYASRLLDSHDNLPMSSKFLVDAIAEQLTGKTKGKGDNDPRLTWKYDQEKSKLYGIKITFSFKE